MIDAKHYTKHYTKNTGDNCNRNRNVACRFHHLLNTSENFACFYLARALQCWT